MKYYTSIDGLRALAVMLVLFFHAGFSFAEGGYIGVDIFFVISGFLITGLIIHDIDANKWSFLEFYKRRAARLLPALFATIFFTGLIGILVLSPGDLKRLASVSVFSAFSVGNIYFWQEAGYFDQAVATKPLLHTWSLGVEEQFYLVWPAVLFFLKKLYGKKGLVIGLSLLGALSIAAAFYLHQKSPDSVFYLMPFRIHQFALGGLTALIFAPLNSQHKNIALVFAVGAMLASAVLASGEGGSFLLNTILPTAGAALFIWSSEASIAKTIFSSRAMIWLGKRSYSIYLVHWPLMVFWLMATDHRFTILESVTAILISIALGAILFENVENRFRFTSDFTQPNKRKSLVAALAMLIGCELLSVTTLALRGFDFLTPAEIRLALDELSSARDYLVDTGREGRCSLDRNGPITAFDVEFCANPPENERSYLVIGNSHADEIYLALVQAYPDIYFGQFTVPGCTLLAQDTATKTFKEKHCATFYDIGFQTAIDGGFDGVIFSSTWKGYHKDNFEKLQSWAAQHHLSAIFFTQRPWYEERIPELVARSRNRKAAQNRADLLFKTSFQEAANKMELFLDGKAKVVNMFELMCDGECPIFTEEGAIIYKDNNHFTTIGAAWFAGRLLEKYPDLFDDQQ